MRKSSSPKTESFPEALAAVRASWGLTRVMLARETGISVRSLARWEVERLRPRRGPRITLLAYAAQRDHPAASRLAAALGVEPPPDPTPLALPAPPPVPVMLQATPVEVALFRTAESMGVSAAALRPALTGFLAHLAELGVSPAEALAGLNK